MVIDTITAGSFKLCVPTLPDPSVVADVLDGHRPSIWVSDLYSAQQGHKDL